MPAEGHQTRRSETDQPVIKESAVLEAIRVSRVTVPYYVPVRRTRPERGGIVREAAMVGAEAEPLDTGAGLPDAAVASFGDGMVLEAIIGNDDRIRVKEQNLRRNPFRQICALRIKASTGSMFVGTGWLIGPRALATAGHCVFMQNEGGWAEFIDVIPGKFGGAQPLGKFRASRFRAVDGWIDQQKRDFDYGVILLDDGKPGDDFGWFAVSAESDGQLQGVQANISGYPADKDQANFQYFHARPVMSVTPERLNYDVDTFGGQSGSPVWQDSSDGIVAIGVHTNGGITSNSGTRITGDVVDNFAAWRDE